MKEIGARVAKCSRHACIGANIMPKDPTGEGRKEDFFPHTIVLWCFFSLLQCSSSASHEPLGCLLVDEVALKLTVVLNLGTNGSCFNLAYGFLHTSMMHVDSLSFPKPLKPPRFGQAQGANRRDNSDIDFSYPSRLSPSL